MKFCWFMIALAILELIAVIVILKKMKKHRIGGGKRLLVFLTYLILSFVTVKFAFFPPILEVKTTGAYNIASEDYWIETEQTGVDGNKREIQVRAWYPKNYDGAEHSAKVIVFSHGSCGTIDNNLSLYRELASHGYVVLAVAHEGQAISMVRSDGKTIRANRDYLIEMINIKPQHNPEGAYSLYSKWMKERMSDLNLVMDDFKEKVKSSDEIYAKIADADEYIVAGHSSGGSAAYAMARTREDVCACIALEAPFMYDIKGVENGEFIFDTSDYNVPILNIYTDSSYNHLREWKQYKNNVLFLQSDNDNYVNIYYSGIGHMEICDLSLASPFLAVLLDGVYPEVSALEQLAVLNADCLKFLQTECGISKKQNNIELTGPWHLDSERNDLIAFQDIFPCYAEFGAGMEIKTSGQIYWYIGAEGGSGTYTQSGNVLTVDFVSDANQQPVTVIFDVVLDNETASLVMEYNGTSVYWIYGDSGEPTAVGE